MLTQDDWQLVSEARNFLEKHYKPARHHVACALRSGSNVYFGLHLDTSGLDVCAEPTAIAGALMAQERTLDCIVAVGWSCELIPQLVTLSPCGDCRQLFLDFAPEMRVIVPAGPTESIAVLARELLPYPYSPSR